ncbi:MAG: hypothetical protein ACP6IY_18250, partial [Promethearchaeia archaeon]
NTNKVILKYLLEYGLIPAKIKVVFDIHKQLFYGKKDNPYVFGILAEKGTKKAYKWQTCAIILKGFELQVGSQMMQKGGKKEPFIKKMLNYLESTGFIVELVIMDREYYIRDILKYLTSKNITYIVPVKESKTLKSLKEKALNDPKKRAQTYGMKDGYSRGVGYNYYFHKIGFYAKKRMSFGKLRLQYKHMTVKKENILTEIFALATNQSLSAPINRKKYKFYKIRYDYGDRWRIEVAYREGNPFITYSTSKIPDVRNVYFIIALLLYNLWILANLFLRNRHFMPEKRPIAFFKEYIYDVFLLGLQIYIGLDPPYSEFCREDELKILRCIII